MGERDELDAVVSMLTHWVAEVNLRNAMNDMSINRTSENLIVRLLNAAYDYNLTNLNWEHNNYPTVDLGDCKRGVAFQVTSTDTLDKIRKTLEKFYAQDGPHKKFTEGLFFFFLKEKPPSLKTKAKLSLKEIAPNFDPLLQMWSIKNLLMRAEELYSMDRNRFNNFKLILEEEFGKGEVKIRQRRSKSIGTHQYHNDFWWLSKISSSQVPVQIIFGASPKNQTMPEPSISHYLIALLKKYTPLLPPLIHEKEKLHIEMAQHNLLSNDWDAKVPKDVSKVSLIENKFFALIFGTPPDHVDCHSMNGMCFSKFSSLKLCHNLIFVDREPDISMFLILKEFAEIKNQRSTCDKDLACIPYPHREKIIQYQARYWLPSTNQSETGEMHPSLHNLYFDRDIKTARKALDSYDYQAINGIIEELSPDGELSSQQKFRSTYLKCAITLSQYGLSEIETILEEVTESSQKYLLSQNLAILFARQGRVELAEKFLTKVNLGYLSNAATIAKSIAESWIAAKKKEWNQTHQKHLLDTIKSYGKESQNLCSVGYFHLSLIYHDLGNLDKASEYIDRVLDSHPTIAENHLHKALIHISYFPKAANLYRSNNLVSFSTEHPSEALISLERAERIAWEQSRSSIFYFIYQLTGIASYHLALATRHAERKSHFIKAAEAFGRASKRSPQNYKLKQYEGNSWLQAEKYGKAIKVYTAIPPAQRTISSDSNLVVALLLAGKIDSAIEETERLLQSARIPSELLANLGLMLYASNQPKIALETLNLARTGVGSALWKVEFLRGRILYDLAKFQEAEETFRNAIELNSHNPRLYRDHFVSFEKGRKPRIEKRVAQVEKIFCEFYYNLDPIHQFKNFIANALTAYKKEIQRSQNEIALPGESIPHTFNPHVKAIDRIKSIINIIEEALPLKVTWRKMAFITKISREFLKKEEKIKGNSFGFLSENTGEETEKWVKLHEKIEDEKFGQASNIRVDRRNSSILAKIIESKLKPSILQWFHLNALKAENEAETENLRVYDHVDKIEIKSYQREIVERTIGRLYGRVLLADETGLGKTIEACLILKEYHLRGLIRSCLIIVHSGRLADQWLGELTKHFRFKCDEKNPEVAIYKSKEWRSINNHFISILTFNSAVANQDLLLKKKWDIIIVDEAHKLRNRVTKRFKLLKQLQHRYLLLLTATPMQNSLQDLFSLFHLLRPTLFGTFADFKASYFNSNNPRKVRNKEDLKRKIYLDMLRNTAKGVAKELNIGKRSFQHYNVTLSKQERELYDSIEKIVLNLNPESTSRSMIPFHYYLLTREVCSSPWAASKTLEKLASKSMEPNLADWMQKLASIAKNTLPIGKLNEVKQILPRLGGEKVIIFTEFRETARCIEEQFGALAIDSRLSESVKQKRIDTFRYSDSFQILVATPMLSEGLNFQECRNIINFDLPWNPFRMEQRIGRVHRFGQKADEINIFTISSIDTVEDFIRQLLIEKLQIFERIIGDMGLHIIKLDGGKSFESRIRFLLCKCRDRETLKFELNKLFEDEIQPFFSSESISLNASEHSTLIVAHGLEGKMND